MLFVFSDRVASTDSSPAVFCDSVASRRRVLDQNPPCRRPSTSSFLSFWVQGRSWVAGWFGFGARWVWCGGWLWWVGTLLVLKFLRRIFRIRSSTFLCPFLVRCRLAGFGCRSPFCSSLPRWTGYSCSLRDAACSFTLVPADSRPSSGTLSCSLRFLQLENRGA